MTYFRDSEHLYDVFGALFERVSTRAELSDAMLAGDFVLRMRYTEPEAQITVDLRGDELKWTCGDSELTPDLELIQSGDVAHRFWLGRLNITGALATRKVVSRGPVAKALKLLPALKPVYPIYEQLLRERGEEALLAPLARSNGGGGVAGAWRAAQDLGRRIARKLGRRPAVELVGHRRPVVPTQGADPTPEPTSAPDTVPSDDVALRREMLSRMALIRAFEQCLSDENSAGRVPTEAIHLSIGQEATAVGVCFALRPDDHLATTHRGHGHMLAKGADLDGMMAEMFAKSTGLCGGKGGSMHVTDARVGAIGANGIVGASPLLAAGAAHAAKLSGADSVAVAFLGDGATNQGMFHEGMNFAAVLDLPVIFVVENNGYGEFTPVARHCRVERLADRAAAYGMRGVTVDGNDVWAVYEAATDAVARARRGEGPTLLECVTYRWHGHMEGDNVPYRAAEEVAEWRERCPIHAWKKRLADDGHLSAEDGAALVSRADGQVRSALERAQAAPEPPDAELETDVYAPDPPALHTAVAPVAATREITCAEALYEALSEELERDESVYLLGEDVTTGGYFAVTVGLADRFGPERIVDTPISEYAIVGSAVGAAMTGARPVAEILFSDFLTTCMDPLVNNAAKLRYMSGGQYRMPLTVRTPGGAGLGMAAQHSQSLEAWLTSIPGLLVLAPATPYDAKGLLKAAIRSDNPVLFFENKLLYAETGPVPQTDYVVPMGHAAVQRPGSDVTVVSVGAALSKAREAAEQLAAQHIEAELVDVRSLVPLDLDTILASVVKTGRLITVEDAPLGHGFGSEIVARVTEVAFDALRAAPRRVAAADVPLPYCSRLENLALPDARRIVEAARYAVGR